MPRRSLSPCAAPGCPELTRDRRCPNHAPDSRTPDTRTSAAARGYDRHWRRKRDAQLTREPICRTCLAEGRGPQPATQVDHITPKRDGGTDASDNLQSLCATCHSRKTQAGR